MTKLFAVAYIDFFNNDLTVEFHRATSWHEALGKHSKFMAIEDNGEYLDFLSSMPIEEAQGEAFNGDWMFDVKEVPAE